MKRLISSSVSEALMNALEHADEMENVLIVAWNKDGQGNGGGQSFSDREMTAAQCLMIIEQFKLWLMTHSVNGDES